MKYINRKIAIVSLVLIFTALLTASGYTYYKFRSIESESAIQKYESTVEIAKPKNITNTENPVETMNLEVNSVEDKNPVDDIQKDNIVKTIKPQPDIKYNKSNARKTSPLPSANNSPISSNSALTTGSNQPVPDNISQSSNGGSAASSGGGSSGSGGGGSITTPPSNNPPAPPLVAPSFAMFDATEFPGKPTDLSHLGFKVIKSVYEWDIYKYDPATLIPSSGIIAAAQAARGSGTFRMASGQADLYMLDVERIDLFEPDDTILLNNINNMITSYSLFKQTVGDGKPVGYYGQTPNARPYAAVKPQTDPAFIQWRHDMDRMAALALQMDVLMPNSYTHSTDRDFWVKAVEVQVAEGRRVKPNTKVYVLLSPFYVFNNQELPADFWRLQLDTIYRIADGVIIWVVDRNKPWDPNAIWFQTTLQFMREKSITDN